jgi:hypothetical protein
MGKPLKEQSGEWRRGSGAPIQLCVVEELDVEADHAAESIITFGGFSLCREHFKKVTDLIKDGTPMGVVVAKMMTVGLDAEDPAK